MLLVMARNHWITRIRLSLTRHVVGGRTGELLNFLNRKALPACVSSGQSRPQ